MPLTDMPLDELARYRPEPVAPADFDDFWAGALRDARAKGAARGDAPVLTPVEDTLLTTVDVHDVRFPGWNGEPVAAWLLVPRGTARPLPVLVKYIGSAAAGGGPPTICCRPPPDTPTWSSTAGARATAPRTTARA